MKKSLLLLSTLLVSLNFFFVADAQDTLPNFSLRNVGNNRIIISWTNFSYPTAKQISIQRSTDSLKGYKTIVTVPDPTTVQNGYVDTKAPTGNMFYRLFIVLNGARYFFSSTKRPFSDSIISKEKNKTENPFGIEINKPGKFNDSITNGIGVNKIKPDIFTPSNFVYTAKDGNVHLNFPHADTMNYSVKFFDDKDQFLFEIKGIKEPSLIVDKTNFYHAGWFKFELYVNDKLKEKNKFYLAKEF